MGFSETIKKIRQQELLTQDEFAKAVGVSFATVNRWEAGKTIPSFKAKKLINTYCKENGIEFSREELF